MKFRTGLKPSLGLINEFFEKARKTEDVVEKERLTSVAKLMLEELKAN